MWRELTAELGDVRWPRETVRTFASAEQLARELRRVQARAPASLPEVDFHRERLLVVAAGPRSTAAPAVRVVRVRERRGRVDVEVRETGLAARRPGLSFPYALIALPASDKPLAVRWLGR